MNKEKVSVGLIELDFHADNLQELVEMFLLKYDQQILTIHLILKKDVFEIVKYSMTKYENVICHVYDNNISHHQCLYKSQDIIQNCDIIFINTIAKNIKAFTLLKHDFIILRVHNANKQFASIKHIDWSVNSNNLVLLLKFFIKEVVFNNYFQSIKKINNNVKLFSFSDIEMLNYARKNFKMVTLENSIYIPLKYYRENVQMGSEKAKPIINISIIGRIDDETRDIHVLSSVIQKISTHRLCRKVCIKFIGTGKKKTMVNLENTMTQIRNEEMTFEYTYENVDQEFMIDFIKNSDLILSPLKIECKVGIFLETYGKTKVSGNFSDIAISPQPVFLPVEYIDHVAEDDEFTTCYHNVDELTTKIIKCINDNKYLDTLKKNAISEAKRRYGRETILKQFSKIDVLER